MGSKTSLAQRGHDGAGGEETCGVTEGPGQRFDTSEAPLSEFSVRKGVRPPKGCGLEVDVDLPLDLDLDSLKEKCIQVGAVAFLRRERAFFKCLVREEKWIQSELEDEEFYILDNVSPPSHLTDVYLQLPGKVLNEQFSSLSVQVEFFTDVSPSENFYLCFFGGETTHGPFYGGLQTNIGCPSCGEIGPRLFNSDQQPCDLENATQLPSQKQMDPYFGAIFSRWGEANMADIAIPDGEKSFGEAAAYEGTFCSVRRHMRWGKGIYTLRLVVDRVISNGVWVRFEVQALDNEPTVVGWLFFAGSHPFRLTSATLYNFTEIYGENTSLFIEDFSPGFSFCVSDLRINGVPIQPKSVSVEYFHQVPLISTCSKYTNRPEFHILNRVGVLPIALSSMPCPKYGTYKLW